MPQDKSEVKVSSTHRRFLFFFSFFLAKVDCHSPSKASLSHSLYSHEIFHLTHFIRFFFACLAGAASIPIFLFFFSHK